MNTSKTAFALSLLCFCAVFAEAAELAQAKREQINQALDSPADFDFAGTPLKDAMAYLADKYQIPVLLDHRSLDDAGVSADSVMLNYRPHKLETLRGALQRVLWQSDLAYVVRDEVLQITTPEAAESVFTVRIYPVKDVPPVSGKPFLPEEPVIVMPARYVASDGTLIGLLQTSVATTTWDESGGPGSMRQLGDQLIVSATAEVHRELESLLAGLKKYAPFTPDNTVPETTFVYVGTAAPRPEIIAALKAPTTVDFVETPLTDVVAFLRDLHDIPLVIDRRALDDAGIGDPTITFAASGMSLNAVLKHTLASVDLIIRLDGEAILITHEIDRTDLLGLHYVADLMQVKLPDGSVKLAPQELIACIKEIVEPAAWNIAGDWGACEVCGSYLVVSQTPEAHAEIRSFLKELRTRQAGQPLTGAAPEAPYIAAYRLGRMEETGKAKKPVKISAEEVEKVAAALEHTIRPQQWKSAGGENSIEVVQGAILVRAPRSVHRNIRAILEQLELITLRPPPLIYFSTGPSPVPPPD